MLWLIIGFIVLLFMCRKGKKEDYPDLNTRVSDLESTKWSENNYHD